MASHHVFGILDDKSTHPTTFELCEYALMIRCLATLVCQNMALPLPMDRLEMYMC